MPRIFTNLILLDAAMSAGATLVRLAYYGVWTNPHVSPARDHIAAMAERCGLPFDEAATRLSRTARNHAVAIRQELTASVGWYARLTTEVLDACAAAPSDRLLSRVLNLDPRLKEPGHVVIEGTTPVSVRIDGAETVDDQLPRMESLPKGDRRRRRRSAHTEKPTVDAWPRLDAPEAVVADVPFLVTVGLSMVPLAGVLGGRVTLFSLLQASIVRLSVELIADDFDSANGWSQPLQVSREDPASAEVAFELVPRLPAEAPEVRLTTLEVRFVFEGSVCGTAARPIAISRSGLSAAMASPRSDDHSSRLTSVSGTPVSLPRERAPDLTIELAQPGKNSAMGRYVCRLYSPHAIGAHRGPHDVDLGEDAKTFARGMVDQIRNCSQSLLIDAMMRALGNLIAEKLPEAVFGALREVSTLTSPAPPAVLIISADPYVPWELASVTALIDRARPPFLGAQVLLGRWVWQSSSAEVVAGGETRVPKPPLLPVTRIEVSHMAALAGKYMKDSGLVRLPGAEEEVAGLEHSHNAIRLPATPAGLMQLLDATVVIGKSMVAPEAMHFSGHGDVDLSQSDASRIFLDSGQPLSSLLFRGARYGEEFGRQPLVFLNACMSGIGGELLGDMGGFPGNCLRGGFGAVVGALWEVDDAIAKAIASEFWSRVLPPAGMRPEPVASVLRDLRARYHGNGSSGVDTYLAYVYYGHPNLVLTR